MFPTSKSDPLAEASVTPIRIRFYVDGYHSYLLSDEVVGLHRSFLNEILKRFPNHSHLFDLQPSPEKRAALVLGLLLRAEQVIVDRKEKELERDGLDVIPHNEVRGLRNPLRKVLSLSDKRYEFTARGKCFVTSDSYGVVFCPTYNRMQLERQIEEYINSLTVDARYYELVIDELEQKRRSLGNGSFDRTQRFYDALADEIGDTSRRGYLKLSRNIRRGIEEKAVDGDMIAAIADDAYTDVADTYVLLTNDADHAPLAERLVGRGKQILVIGYAQRPATALLRAVGADNVLNLLTEEREFDFDPVWLRDENPDALRVLEDMRMQWHWWKSRGMA